MQRTDKIIGRCRLGRGVQNCSRKVLIVNPKIFGYLKTASQVEVAKDKLSATFTISVTDNEFSQVTEEDVRKILSFNGVSYGIEPDALSTICSRITGGPVKVGPVVIAKGTPPQKGEKGDLTLQFSQNLKVGENKNDGRIDYRERGAVHQVKEGEVLATVTLPTKGTPGMSVAGKELPAPKTPFFKLPKAGKGVAYDEQNRQFVAEQSGNVAFDKEEFTVSPEFVVPGDIDYSVGNIHFGGDVIVNGNVQKGFTVDAEGSIDVRGDIEPKVQLRAGKNVTVQGTCRGSSKKEKPLVRAEGDLQLYALNDISVYARGNVSVTGPVLNSSIYALGRFESTGNDASIRGSRIEAVAGINAAEIGVEEGETNTLVAGITLEAAGKIEKIQEELARVQQHHAHVMVSFEKNNEELLKKRNLSKQEKEQLSDAKAKATAKQEVLDEKLHSLKEELSEWEANYAEDRTATVYIERAVYPVTNIHIYRHNYVLSTNPRTDVIFYDSDKNVMCQGREEYEKQKAQREADPDELLKRFKQGGLNPAQLVSGLEKYNALGKGPLMQTAVNIGLKAVTQREYQNYFTWCETARSLAILSKQVQDSGQREQFLKQAALSAKKAVTLKPDSPGPNGVFGMVAACRGDLKGALGSFKKAASFLQNSKKRVSFKRDECVFVLYAETLVSIAESLRRKKNEKQAVLFEKEAHVMADEYLKKQPKGVWAQRAKAVQGAYKAVTV